VSTSDSEECRHCALAVADIRTGEMSDGAATAAVSLDATGGNLTQDNEQK